MSNNKEQTLVFSNKNQLVKKVRALYPELFPLTKEEKDKRRNKKDMERTAQLLDTNFFPVTVQSLRNRGFKVVVKHMRLDREDAKKTMLINNVQSGVTRLMRNMETVVEPQYNSLESIQSVESDNASLDSRSFSYMMREHIKKGEIFSRGGLTKVTITRDDLDGEYTGTSICNITDNYHNRLGVTVAIARAIGHELVMFADDLGVQFSTEAQELIEELCECQFETTEINGEVTEEEAE